MANTIPDPRTEQNELMALSALVELTTPAIAIPKFYSGQYIAEKARRIFGDEFNMNGGEVDQYMTSLECQGLVDVAYVQTGKHISQVLERERGQRRQPSARIEPNSGAFKAYKANIEDINKRFGDQMPRLRFF
ncbi:hypothetical protein COU58_02600 [Candidatus Pacearchaeota archaeon CG10_big_fil_rev_8_21_14_0_10_32_42]|nr:MAG: hypothetical protein COU58_02600 [Candidatus Pacearchaeota archaeon CG10_big_fil_rev_8_21_14_0_10_32_42]